MNPVILQIGPFTLTWYGLLIVGGALIAAWIATVEAKRRGENPDHVWNVLAWVLILGIIGARLYHVFSDPVGGRGWSYYRENPLDIINFWQGGFRGLGIYGAVVGGFIAIALYCWRQKLSLWRWLDIVVPGLLLAQAVGRLGNRINQELYGPPTDLPWGFRINPQYDYQIPVEMLGRSPAEIQNYIANTRFHPTFYYEGLWNLLGFALVMWGGRRFQRRLRDGDIFLFYLIWYPLGRFGVEMLRPDAWISGLGGLTTAQVISIISIVGAIVVLILRHRNWSPEEKPQVEAATADAAEQAPEVEGEISGESQA